MLNNIQILRAFAALNVVLFHILSASDVMGMSPKSMNFLQGWGECGVDIFFVISGFVMVVAHLGKNIGPVEFMLLRIQRIVPVYWLLTFLVLAVYLVQPQLLKTAAPSELHIISSLFFVSGALLDKVPVLYVGWSLEYEMLFYIIFSLCLLFSGWGIRIGFQIICMAAFVLLFDANIILLEFIFGIMAGGLFVRNVLKPYALAVAVIGFILLFCSVFIKFEYNRLIIWGVPSLLVVWGVAMSSQVKNKFINYLGTASYSIYLVQVFSLPACYKLAKSSGSFVPNDVVAFLAMILTVLLGCLLHQYIEKPIYKWLKY